MTNIPIRKLLGLSGVPSHRTSASRWLEVRGILTRTIKGKGGNIEVLDLADLPIQVRRAYQNREITEAGLPAGSYDDAAHEAFAAATPAMQAIALRKAEIARFLVKGGAGAGFGLSANLMASVRQKFGADGTDRMTLRRILQAVEGIDPVNFAPALAPRFFRGGRPQSKISDQAWAFFMTTIRDAGPQFPLKQAWRDVRDAARRHRWEWPPYRTVMRR